MDPGLDRRDHAALRFRCHERSAYDRHERIALAMSVCSLASMIESCSTRRETSGVLFLPEGIATLDARKASSGGTRQLVEPHSYRTVRVFYTVLVPVPLYRGTYPTVPVLFMGR